MLHLLQSCQLLSGIDHGLRTQQLVTFGWDVDPSSHCAGKTPWNPSARRAALHHVKKWNALQINLSVAFFREGREKLEVQDISHEISQGCPFLPKPYILENRPVARSPMIRILHLESAFGFAKL